MPSTDSCMRLWLLCRLTSLLSSSRPLLACLCLQGVEAHGSQTCVDRWASPCTAGALPFVPAAFPRNHTA